MKVHNGVRCDAILYLLTYICKLNGPKLSKIRKTIVGGIFIHNDGDVLHRLGTEPFRHGAFETTLSRQECWCVTSDNPRDAMVQKRKR